MFVFQGHLCFGSSVSWIIKKKKVKHENVTQPVFFPELFSFFYISSIYIYAK